MGDWQKKAYTGANTQSLLRGSEGNNSTMGLNV